MRGGFWGSRKLKCEERVEDGDVDEESRAARSGSSGCGYLRVDLRMAGVWRRREMSYDYIRGATEMSIGLEKKAEGAGGKREGTWDK